MPSAQSEPQPASPQPQQPPPQSFVVTVIPATPTPERHPGEIIADILIGSFGLIAGLLMIALVLGGVLGGIRVAWTRRFRPETDRMPPVSPSVPPDSDRRSDQAR